MLEAGTGVRMPGVPEPVDPQVAEAKAAFLQIFPHLAPLVNDPRFMEKLSAIAEGIQDPSVLQRLPDAVSAADHGWQQHARTTLNGIYSTLQADYGTERLTPAQQTSVGREFMAWLQSDPQGQRTQRYQTGDPTLTQEFVAHWRGEFVTPFRRGADAATIAAGQRNAQLPGAPRTSGMTPVGQPPAQARTSEDVHESAWQSMVAARAAGQ